MKKVSILIFTFIFFELLFFLPSTAYASSSKIPTIDTYTNESLSIEGIWKPEEDIDAEITYDFVFNTTEITSNKDTSIRLYDLTYTNNFLMVNFTANATKLKKTENIIYLQDNYYFVEGYLDFRNFNQSSNKTNYVVAKNISLSYSKYQSIREELKDLKLDIKDKQDIINELKSTEISLTKINKNFILVIIIEFIFCLTFLISLVILALKKKFKPKEVIAEDELEEKQENIARIPVRKKN